MVQLRDIFPALLLVGCTGKTVLFCCLWKRSAFAGLLVPCACPLVIWTGGVHPPSRVVPQAFYSAGAAVARQRPMLISLLACSTIRLFIFHLFILLNKGTLLLTCRVPFSPNTHTSLRTQWHARLHA